MRDRSRGDALGLRNPANFTLLPHGKYKCNLCSTTVSGRSVSFSLSHAKMHEDTERHRNAVFEYGHTRLGTELVDRLSPIVPHLSSPPLSPLSPSSYDTSLILPSIFHDAIPGPALPHDSEDEIYDDSGYGIENDEDTSELRDNDMSEPQDDDIPPTPELDDQLEADSAISTHSSSDEEPSWQLDTPFRSSSGTSSNFSEVDSDWSGSSNPGNRYSRSLVDDEKVAAGHPWYPWTSETVCVGSIPWALPRTALSQSGLEAFRWMATALGIPSFPSLSSLKRARKRVMNIAGTKPTIVTGHQGHLYAASSFETIFAHEMANPLVRPRLRFYADDAGVLMDGPWHATRWQQEVHPDLSGPMVRQESKSTYQDYYVYEPCLIKQGSEITPVLPTRWFSRNGVIWGKVHLLDIDPYRCGYLVTERHLDLPISSFFLSYPRFLKNCVDYHLPSPDSIIGNICYLFRFRCQPMTYELFEGFIAKRDLHGQVLEVEPWTYPIKNVWRTKANGRKCLVLPFWLYCDDTSGNLSKKWNKHNSFLFTLAGLEQAVASLPFNIHFLSTSNIAYPTEMLENLVSQIKHLRFNGFVAYDCVEQGEVLFIPWVYGFQGDNPMQSEIASHIGLTGKFFCRACWVRGKDKSRPTEGPNPELSRILEFMQAGERRNKSQTLHYLEEQLNVALSGFMSKLDKLQTATGVKDKRLSHFVEILKNQKAQIPKLAGKAVPPRIIAEHLQRFRTTCLPEDLFNPAFSIPDFDPNTDTPVEILHVILLGIVKYFWRDAVARQDTKGREELECRLSSFDVNGLGIPRLRGHILVQYAKSLTGRDFRAILQVAPLVLQGLIPDRAYSAWLALCRLAPLAFQPVITNISEYLVDLEATILDFLKATALWTTQWFNKPKFHILLHLVENVRRFGPAPAFATEGFESYNSVIRSQSVLSNRQAPSRDIAHSFSFHHAVRHLVCGGWFWDVGADGYRQAGNSVLSLWDDKVFRGLFNAPPVQNSALSYCFAKGPEYEWSSTVASRYVQRPRGLMNVRRLCTAKLLNGDVVKQGFFVLVSSQDSTSSFTTEPARIEELLISSPTNNRSVAMALVRHYHLGSLVSPYFFPSLRTSPGPSGYRLMNVQDIMAAINTVHNCAHNNCSVAKTRPVYQERIETSLFMNEIKHENLEDLLINLAQMRSAQHVHQYYGRNPHHDITVLEAAKAGLLIVEQMVSGIVGDNVTLATGTETQYNTLDGSGGVIEPGDQGHGAVSTRGNMKGATRGQGRGRGRERGRGRGRGQGQEKV